MPLQICTLDGKPGWKWGDKGTCYTYEKGDEVSENDARENAHKQGVAIGYSGSDGSGDPCRRCYDMSGDIFQHIKSFKLMKARKVMTQEQALTACDHFQGLPKQDMSAYEVIGRFDDLTRFLNSEGDVDERRMLTYHRFLNTSSINPRPEEESFMDGKNVLIRYKYEGPLKSTSREFCIYMINNHSMDYFRREDINQMSFSRANPDFGTYSIWNYKGSYNCGHAWVAYIFRLKKGEDVSDAQSVTRSSGDSSNVNSPVN